MLSTLDLTPAQASLEALYCPTKRRPPRDPVCMLRLFLLMLLCRVGSITTWITTLRGSPLLAVMTGFSPDAIPGIGTCYAFLDRLVNGPYQKPCPHVTRPAEDLKVRHTRRLSDKTAERHDYPPIYHSQSEALAAELLAHADDPRPTTLRTRMEDLLAMLGILPSIEAGLFEAINQLHTSGDGSPLETDASPTGRPTCDCPPDARQHKTCDHPRDYTSGTAQWCSSTGRPRDVFGDRYYHLATRANGHDVPLLTYMGVGNEADHPLSLKAMDDLLKLNRARTLGLTIQTFAGDMHHDTTAHAGFYPARGILTAIPLRDTASLPHLDTHPDLTLDADGTPRCPGAAAMRHHNYAPDKDTPVFACPAKRDTHRDGHQCC